MRLLKEYILPEDNLLEHVLERNSKTGEKNIFLRGVFTVSDQKNRNGRIYPHKILEREINKLDTLARTTVLCGNLEHPNQPEINLADAAFRILKIEQNPRNKNQFIGEGKILKETQHGATAAALAAEGLMFGVSSRALGNLIEREDGIMEVDDTLQLLNFDLVQSPSCAEAYLKSFYEGVEYYIEPSTGYIKEDTSATLKNKLYSLPKARLEEGVLEIYREFLSAAFNK